MDIDELKNSLNKLYIEEINSKNDYYNNISILNEGLLKLFKDKISRKLNIGQDCYYVTQYNYNTKIGDKRYVGKEFTKTKTSAIKYFFVSTLKVATIDNNKLYIYKKYKNKLDKYEEDIHLLKGKVIEIGKYNDTFMKVTESKKVTMNDLLNQVDYEYKDNSAMVNKRKQIYTKVMNITKQVLNEIGKEKLNKGFTLVKLDEDEKEYVEKFLDGFNNYFSIIDCDAWKFTNNKARDEEEYEKYNDAFMEILSKLDEKFKANNIPGKTDYHGDWDDGPIVFVLKEE